MIRKTCRAPRHHLISQFVRLNVAPLWSLTVIVIDILVIWAVMVHGKELKDY